MVNSGLRAQSFPCAPRPRLLAAALTHNSEFTIATAPAACRQVGKRQVRLRGAGTRTTLRAQGRPELDDPWERERNLNDF